MSASALLAKAGKVILTDENLRKKAVTVVLTIVTAFLVPFMAIASVFAGIGEVSSETVQNQFTDATKAELGYMGETAEKIAYSFSENGLSYSEVAQADYCMYLYDVEKSDPQFMEKLLSCYTNAITDSEVVTALNAAFNTGIPAEEYHSFAEKIRSTCIDTSSFVNPEVKNNTDLVTYVLQAAETGWGYVYGTYGTVLTESILEQKAQQFPDNILPYKDFISENWMGRRTADCVGLIKGYAWYDIPTSSFSMGANGMPDLSADGMYAAAAVKGTMETMPDVPGIAVWQSGHIGVYVGNGTVVEAKGTMYGVVKSELAKGSWQGWCYLPAIQYNA